MLNEVLNIDQVQLVIDKAISLAKNVCEIIENRNSDVEFPVQFNYDELVFKEEVSILLKGKYTIPVIDCKLFILHYGKRIGYYEYIVQLDYDFVDEFFVLS